jgi:hypothetical protein
VLQLVAVLAGVILVMLPTPPEFLASWFGW